MKRLNRGLIYLLVVLMALPFRMTYAAEAITYFHNDAAGTPMLATNAAGNVLWKESYEPYGGKLKNQAASTNNKIGFAGKPYDSATGLSYMGARYYDPLVGRFTGIDPVDYQQDNLHSFNRYTYANNNPYKYTDPSGQIAETVWDVASIAMGVTSLSANIGAGNIGAAAVDAVGIVVDSAAAVTPVVPGGQELLSVLFVQQIRQHNWQRTYSKGQRPRKRP